MADINVVVPSVRKGASADEKIDNLYKYANQLNDQLAYVLNNLDLDSMSDDVRIKLNNAISATSEGGEMQQSVQDLKADILKNATDVRQDIETVSKEMNAYITAKSGDMEWVQQAKGIFTQNAYGQEYAVQVADYINKIFGDGENAKKVVIGGTEYTYNGLIKSGFYDTGSGRQEVCLIIAANRPDGTVMKSVHTPDRVVFKSGDDEKGHFGADDMYIDDCRTHSIRFAGGQGDAATQYFSIVPVMNGADADRGLELRWGDTSIDSGIVG